MSSGFVSGGTADTPIERSDEWLAAQKEIEANIVKRQEANRQAATGRSLFETLEANKVAKQEAFEEANRLKNQFRALDEDEIDFLDSVLESTRAEEDRVKRETADGLQLFRQHQEEVDKKARGDTTSDAMEDGSQSTANGSWATSGRKRKRVKDKEVLKGVKIRRSSTTEDTTASPSLAPESSVASNARQSKNKDEEDPRITVQTSNARHPPHTQSATTPAVKKPPAPLVSSLVSYGSAEDDW